MYHTDPVEKLADQRIDLLVNMSASSCSDGKLGLREEMLREIATELHVPVLYANLVGGNDSLVFDGASFVIGADGRKIAQARDFVEDLIVFDTERQNGEVLEISRHEIESVYKALVLGTRDYCRKCGFSKAVVACVPLVCECSGTLKVVSVIEARSQSDVVGKPIRMHVSTQATRMIRVATTSWSLTASSSTWSRVARTSTTDAG